MLNRAGTRQMKYRLPRREVAGIEREHAMFYDVERIKPPPSIACRAPSVFHGVISALRATGAER